MHSEAPPPGDHDMSVGDVKSFFAIAQSAIEKTDFLLDLHYNNIVSIKFSPIYHHISHCKRQFYRNPSITDDDWLGQNI